MNRIQELEEALAPFPPEQCRGDKCVFRAQHDDEDQPVGAACGRAATQIIFWDDNRFSPSCGQHGWPALDAHARERVLCIHPIEPPIEAQSE